MIVHEARDFGAQLEWHGKTDYVYGRSQFAVLIVPTVNSRHLAHIIRIITPAFNNELTCEHMHIMPFPIIKARTPKLPAPRPVT